MAVSQFFIISPGGDVLLARNLRNEATADTERVYNQLKEHGDLGPVFELDGMLYFYIKRSGLYFVVATKYVTAPAYVLELLQKITNHLKDFIGILNEESIRNNFVLAYEILDEILDYGYIQCIDVEQLKQKIYNTSTVSISRVRTVTGVDNKHMVPSVVSNKSLVNPNNKNEIFVDILEKVSSTMTAGGAKYTLEGQIQIKSYLRGAPNVELYLTQPPRPQNYHALAELDYLAQSSNTPTSGARAGGDGSVPRTASLESRASSRKGSGREDAFEVTNCTYDESVGIVAVQGDRILKFVPKQGEYTLMTYNGAGPLSLPFKVIPVLDIAQPKIVSCLPDEVSAFFLVTCRLPQGVRDVQTTTYPKYVNQVCDFKHDESTVYWNVKKIQGYSEVELFAEIAFAEEVTSVKQFGPINLMFEVPMFNMSNLRVGRANAQVKYLNIAYEGNYAVKSFKWVRYLTMSNSYTYRF